MSEDNDIVCLSQVLLQKGFIGTDDAEEFVNTQATGVTGHQEQGFYKNMLTKALSLMRNYV